MEQTYELFDLRIFRGQEGIYPVEVLQSPAGEAASECQLPFDLTEIDTLSEQLEAGEADRQQLKQIGSQLYEMLFVPAIERRYRQSLAGLPDGSGLRVRLRIDPPELTRLPWEFLYDAQDDEYINLSPRAPFVRYVSGGEVEKLQVEAPVRLLLVVSSPTDMPPLDTAKEIELVSEALKEQIENGMYVIDILENPTLARLSDKLREGFHILHYLGHAYLDPDSGQGYLILENEDHSAMPVETDSLLPFLKDGSLRLMILNACESGRSGGREAQLGLAPSLVAGGVPAVVAMQFPIPDRTAILFSREFYAALADNAPVDAALSDARKLIRAEVGADSLDWGIPVLFMRAPDGLLLHIEPLPKPKGEALFSRRGWAAIIAGAVIFLLLISGITFGVLRQAGVLPTPEPTLVAAPASDEEFLVLVADFYGKGESQKLEVINRLSPEIEQALADNNITNARVVAVPDQPRTSEEALQLAQRYNASLVVWGWYDDLGFEANVEMIDSPFLASLGGADKIINQASTNLGEVDTAPETLRAYLRGGLANQVNYLVLYIIGRAQFQTAYDAQQLEKSTEAEQAYQKALDRFSDALTAIENLPEENRESLSSEQLYSSVGSSYLGLFGLGAEGDVLDQAAQYFEQALTINPNLAEALYRLGIVYYYQGRTDEAQAMFEQAIEADQSKDKLIATRSYNYLGYLAYFTGDLNKVEEYWQEAYELKPDDVDILINLGYLKYLLGDYDEAIRLTQEAIELNPDESLTIEISLHCNLGLFHLAKGNANSATAAYNAAAEGLQKVDSNKAAEIASACLADLNEIDSQKPELAEVTQPLIDQLENFVPEP